MLGSPEYNSYHNPVHQRAYDIASTRLPGGEIESVMEVVDELLYPANNSVIRTHQATVSEGIFSSYFSHSFTRLDLKSWIWPLETVTLSAEHTIFLGRSALKQNYKIKIDSEVHREDLGPNRVTSMYYLEQIAGEGTNVYATILRPNITGEPQLHDEPMTAYDCQQLYTQLADVIGLAEVDARSRVIVGTNQ